MDGVITDTAKLHAQAWKRLIDAFLRGLAEDEGRTFRPFDLDSDYRRYVDGKPRYDGLNSFLTSRSIELPAGDPEDPPEAETVCGLANRKDAIFDALLVSEGVDVIDGTVELIQELRRAGVRTAVASSSRNCEKILRRAGLSELFDERIDGEAIRSEKVPGKPDPGFFLEAARRLSVDPGACVVFEDALSGVEAGQGGAFAVVVGVAGRPEDRIALKEGGADFVVEVDQVGTITVEFLDDWVREQPHRRPSALREWPAIAERLRVSRPAIFLDYDGTLTPIVDRPEDAVLPTRRRRILERLGQRFPTTLVSGRSREDVFGFVKLRGLNYAGSHGFDIWGAEGAADSLRHEVAGDLVPHVEAVTRELKEELAEIEGAFVEPKRFTVAVHYRLLADEERRRVEEAIDTALARHPDLEKAHGKMVFEIRPRLDWHKGRAVLWLLEALDLDRPGVTPLYVGDDTTDEDAFRALEDRGIAILVSDVPRPTAAHYVLQDTDEVEMFLERLTAI